MPERLKMFASPRQVREIYNAMAPELIEALKEHLTPNDEEVIDPEYQKAREEQLKIADYCALLRKAQEEARQKAIFRDQHCVKCNRVTICNKVGTVLDCYLLNEEDEIDPTIHKEVNRRRNDGMRMPPIGNFGVQFDPII